MSKFKRLFEIIASLLLWILLIGLFIPFLPLLIALSIIKNLEALIYKVEFNATVFDSEDLLWMLDNPKNRFVFSALLVLNGDMKLSDLKEKIQMSLTDAVDENNERLYPKTTQHILSGCVNFYWVNDDEFSIDDHVTCFTGKTIRNKTELEDVIDVLCKQDITIADDTGVKKSPWKVIMIPYYEGKVRKTTILFRVFHALADGSSVANYLLHQLADGKVSYPCDKKKFSENNRKWMIFLGLVVLPFKYLQMLFLKADKHALHANRVVGMKHIAWSTLLDLSLIKDVKNHLEVSVTDILLGCLSTTFNKYFAQRFTEVPKDMLTLFPIDTRSSVEEAKRFGNNLATLPFRIPLENFTLYNSIKEVHKRTTTFKQSGEVFSIKLGWKVASYFLPRCLAMHFVYLTVNKTSCITSFLIGPQEPISILNQQVELITYWPPQCANQGIGISLCSYAGGVRLGVQCDDVIMKKPTEIISSFETTCHSLHELLN